jgi:glutathione reductase (NADPH)
MLPGEGPFAGYDPEPDVLVIGSGVSGQTAAAELAEAGRSVLIVDRREFGGTCSLRGCEPKKTLFLGAEAVERVRRQEGHGPAGDVRLDWRDLVAFKRTFTSAATPRIEAYLRDAGVVTTHATARFTGPDSLEVDGVEYRPGHVIVATGARPRPLGIPGEELVTLSETFLDLDELPARIAFIGGGYVSFEFAHMADAAGSRASILHRGQRVLGGFDPDLAEMLASSYRARGIEVRTDAPVAAVERRGGALAVRLGGGDIVEADMVVHGAGRVPDLEALALEAGGVATGPHGVLVEHSMRSSSNPRVWAIGDAAALGAPLTPVGVAQARVAMRDILDPGSAVFEPAAVPSVVFSDPPLASVGATEQQAAERGLDVDVRLSDMTEWTSMRRIGAPVAGAKTLVDRASGKVLGAHLLGPDAPDFVNVFAAAIMGGLTAGQLRTAVWAYPTSSYEIVYLV